MTERAEGRGVGAGDVELYGRGWLPASPRGVLLLCHGLGEHAGRYGNVVDAVLPDGWAVYGLDLRGHGCPAAPEPTSTATTTSSATSTSSAAPSSLATPACRWCCSGTAWAARSR